MRRKMKYFLVFTKYQINSIFSSLNILRSGNSLNVEICESWSKFGKNYGESCQYWFALYEIQSQMWNHNSKTFATKNILI